VANRKDDQGEIITMFRTLTLAVAALTLSLLTATGAAAAPTNDGSGPVCEAGIGKVVCCKAFVANHCPYVSCCEQGNAAFFTASHCSLCDAHTMERMQRGSTQACATACEAGNGAFFTPTAAKASAGDAPAACCTAVKK
jgi:hypothetical protein